MWVALLDGVEHLRVPRSAYDYFDILSVDEQERALRFKFERHRSRFVMMRVLLRSLIGCYSSIPARSVRLQYGVHGKPYLPSVDLRFNLSHSSGVGALAFTRGREVGVDIERERPLASILHIAAQHFSPAENEALLRLPVADRAGAFFRSWTRKEAFVKATGEGLSRALDAFEFLLEPGETRDLQRIRDRLEVSSRWSLMDLSTVNGFASAIVVEGKPTNFVCSIYSFYMLIDEAIACGAK